MLVRNYLLILFLFIAGCSSVPGDLSDDIVAVPELADDVSSVSNDAPFERKAPSIHVPNGEAFNLWWRYTGNKELEWLIDRAITNSQALQISAQRVVQAKARAVQAGAGSMPSVTAQASYQAEAPEDGLGTVPVGGDINTSEEFEVGLSGSYSPDLWGQRSALRSSAELKLKQAVFQYDAQLLELISQLSKSYFQYLSLNDRILNTRETEKVLTSMLLAMEDRYEQGDATVVEMQIQRSAVFNSKVRLPTLLKERDQLSYQIARLVGVAPGYLQLTNEGLESVALPSGVSGISTEYILRRPDIRAIESGMLAADADLDVARKALLPGLTLTADLSSGSLNPADLFQPNTLIWSTLATLSATVFDGGAKEQEVKYAQSVRNELVESYVDTVFDGLLAARTAVTELEFSGERLAMQRESAKAAKVAQNYGFESYSVGGIDFLTYLDSMQSYQDRQDNLHQLELEYYQAFVDFYSALGGGIPYRDISGDSEVYAGQQVSDIAMLSPATVSKTKYKQTGWLKEPGLMKQSPWLVKLTGVYDYFAVEALMRDLPRRYETLAPAESVLIEVIDVGLPAEDTSASVSDAVWYAVNFSGFSSEEEAQQWCQMLRRNQQRCVVYQPEENFRYAALFDVEETEKRSYQAGESILAKRHKAEHVAENTPLRTSSGGIPLGQMYSLLKIEQGHAWLIGNRSYRVWRFPVGARLAYDGKLKSVNPNRAVVSFDNRDYLLRPLYKVESVESGAEGNLFARLRWGGPSGEIYYHREGDRLYGKGRIESITENRVDVRWGGKLISLPVME